MIQLRVLACVRVCLVVLACVRVCLRVLACVRVCLVVLADTARSLQCPQARTSIRQAPFMPADPRGGRTAPGQSSTSSLPVTHASEGGVDAANPRMTIKERTQAYAQRMQHSSSEGALAFPPASATVHHHEVPRAAEIDRSIRTDKHVGGFSTTAIPPTTGVCVYVCAGVRAYRYVCLCVRAYVCVCVCVCVCFVRPAPLRALLTALL